MSEKGNSRKGADKLKSKTMKSPNTKPAKSKVKESPQPRVVKERAKPEMKKLHEHVKLFKDQLLKKKQSLTNYLRTELSELEAADKHHLADLEEMASDTHDTDSVCEIMAVGSDTIDQIDRALVRIEDGTYGACEDCGDHISFERLEALPFATLCVNCKKKREVLRS